MGGLLCQEEDGEIELADLTECADPFRAAVRAYESIDQSAMTCASHLAGVKEQIERCFDKLDELLKLPAGFEFDFDFSEAGEDGVIPASLVIFGPAREEVVIVKDYRFDLDTDTIAGEGIGEEHSIDEAATLERFAELFQTMLDKFWQLYLARKAAGWQS